MKEEIEVFWAPAPYHAKQQQFNFEYSAPRQVLSPFVTSQSDKRVMACPAIRDHARNLYSFDATIGDTHRFSLGDLDKHSKDDREDYFIAGEGGRIALIKRIASPIEGYIQLDYNLSWLFYAAEPLIAKFTSPYFPVKSPVKNSFMAFGEFDIGSWFRRINLSYFLPLETKEFKIEANDPLIFIEFETNKKVNFRRFILTEEISQISQEYSRSSVDHPRTLLKSRYELARRSKTNLILDKLIREAAVE